MKKIFRVILFFIFMVIGMGQVKTPCEAPEFSQFDFWIGDWELTWEDNQGNSFIGTNTISKILDGCVIEENFKDSNSGFIGKSVSTFSPKKGKWLQTWVDNKGGYMNFEGEMNDGEMILSRSVALPNGKSLDQRMVFKNIEANSFDWSWERSADKGQTWEVSWLIHYVRK
jgi:hypothetical protein